MREALDLARQGRAQASPNPMVGAVVVHLLGQSAWPLAAGVAIMGCGAFLLWMLTRALRGRQR